MIRRTSFRSSKQTIKVLLHVVAYVERNSLKSVSRVDAAGGHEHAAVDDKEILDVVGSAMGVDDGSFGVGPHSRGAHEVPTGGRKRGFGADVLAAGGCEEFFAPGDGVVEHFEAVVAQLVMNFWGWNSVGVLEIGIEGDAVVGIGEVLADDDHPRCAVPDVSRRRSGDRRPRASWPV